MGKKVCSLLMAVVMTVAMICQTALCAEAATEMNAATFNTKIETFKSTVYPNNSTYKDNSASTLGYQCFGYANYLAKYIFGSFPSSRNAGLNVNSGWEVTYGKSAIDSLHIGDIVRYKVSAYVNHSIFVTKISGDTVYYTDANWDMKNTVKWEKKTTIADLKDKLANYLSDQNGGTLSQRGWVGHYTGWVETNMLTIRFHANGGVIPASYKVTTGTSKLTLRKTAGLSGTKLTMIPDGTVLVAETSTTADGYTWIKTTYDGYTGWCAVSDGLASRTGYYLSSENVYNDDMGGRYVLNWAYGTGSKSGLPNDTTLKLTKAGYKFLGWSLSSDGSSTVFDQDDTTLKAENIDPDVKNGSKTVTLYAIWKANAPTVSNISLQSVPDKLNYSVGEALDTTGLALAVAYSDGTTQTVTDGFAVSGFDSASAGEKTVTVTYGGATFTFTVVVKANEALEILKQPESVEAVLGSNVKFAVEAIGGDTYRWQYRRNAAGQWYNTSMTGYNTPELTVAVTAGRNGYEYRCVVTDAEGNKLSSDPAVLTVKAELTFTKQPQSQTVAAGNNARFTVAADGVKGYQWQYRRSETGAWFNTSMTGYNTATLTVQATENRDGYRYRCILTNVVGEKTESQEAVLRVFTITRQPEEQSAQSGTLCTFSAQVSVSEGVQYQWQYRRSAGDSWHNTSMAGYNTPNLQVEVTAGRNGYEYRCVIKGTSGSELATEAAALRVGGKAVISLQPKDTQGAVGQNVQFKVTAENVASYQWQYRKSSSGTWYNTSMSGYKTATLTVSVTEARHGYQYRCKLTGEDGSAVYSNTATLTLGGETAQLRITAQPKDKTATAGEKAVFSVEASGIGLTYRWQYARREGAAWSDTSMPGYYTADLTVSVTTARNGYCYRCVITDKLGNEIITDTAVLTVE